MPGTNSGPKRDTSQDDLRPPDPIHPTSLKVNSRKSEYSIVYRPWSDVPREGAVRPPWWRKLIRRGDQGEVWRETGRDLESHTLAIGCPGPRLEYTCRSKDP